MHRRSTDISLLWSEKRLMGEETPPLRCCTISLHERILNVLGLTHFGTVGTGQDAPPTVGCVSPVLIMLNVIRPVWETRRAW